MACCALLALTALGPAALSPHTDAVADCLAGDLPTREAAIEALRSAGGPAAAERALGLLGKGTGVRCAAAVAVGLLVKETSGKFVDAVADLLVDESEDDGWRALQAGGSSGRPAAFLRKPRCAALHALGNMGCGTGVAQWLRDADWEVRQSALASLGKLGADGLAHADAIAAQLSDEMYVVRAAACSALGELKAPHAEALADAFADSAPSVRAAAVSALAELPVESEEYLEGIPKLLLDDSLQVRLAAVRAVGKVGELAQGYASLLASLLDDSQPAIRREVVLALPKLGEHGAAFADEVSEMLKDTAPAVRAAALDALCAMGCAKSFEKEVRALVSDRDRRVLEAAAQAVLALDA